MHQTHNRANKSGNGKYTVEHFMRRAKTTWALRRLKSAHSWTAEHVIRRTGQVFEEDVEQGEGYIRVLEAMGDTPVGGFEDPSDPRQRLVQHELNKLEALLAAQGGQKTLYSATSPTRW